MSCENFVIGYSAGYFNRNCVLCGALMESAMPLGVFLKGRHHQVCEDCARREASGLFQIVQSANRDFEASCAADAEADRQKEQAPTTPAGRKYFAIGYNNCASNDPCILCGGRTDPQIPVAIFVHDAVVCDDCARKDAPELYEMVRHAYAIRGLFI